ncbi:uncharacterized protein [Periplaneta americana]|uniref:uncharacterized protein n=1 Tax=Periplaneta americana TaxID=6978 RepID=UPI0037E815BE
MYSYLFVCLISISISNSMSSITSICKARLDDQMRENITCQCNNKMKSFQVYEEFYYFENALQITISDCETAVLDASFLSTTVMYLQRLQLHHIRTLNFVTFLPSSLTDLAFVNVRNLTNLSRQPFINVRTLSNLIIKNTNVHKIDSHTFSDFSVERVQFINVTFKNLETNSMNFSGVNNNNKNTIRIINCTFESVQQNSISAIDVPTIQILNSKFKKVLHKQTFNLNVTQFDNNSFCCSKRERNTNCSTSLDILHNIDTLVKHNPQDKCNLLQINYCNSRKTTSLIRSLQYCSDKLVNYGVHETCKPLEPEDPNHNDDDNDGKNISHVIGFNNLSLMYIFFLQLYFV